MNYTTLKKRLNTLMWVIVVLGLVTTIVMFFMPRAVIYPIPSTRINEVKSGTYESYLENGMYKFRVSVEVEDGKITELLNLSSVNIKLQLVQDLFSLIIEKQSLDVSKEYAWGPEVSTVIHSIEKALIGS